MTDLQRTLSPKYGECDMCSNQAMLRRYLSHHLCRHCLIEEEFRLTEEEFYIKASEDCIEAFKKEFGW